MMRAPSATYRFDAIGAPWCIDTDAPLSSQAKHEINAAVSGFDAAFSRFRDDSIVSRLARTGGTATFPDGTDRLFSLYDNLYDVTDGSVTPLVGGTLDDLGYDAAYSFREKPVVRPVPAYDHIVSRQGTAVTLGAPALLDVGAAGKGFLIDEIAAIVRRGHASFTVDASGDLYAFSDPQTVGLEHPDDATRVIGIYSLTTGALCASATNRRAWGGLHHVIDPATARPAQGIAATWAMADSAMLADGLATALFFITPERLARDFAFRYVVMSTDGSVSYSSDGAITLYD